MFHQSKWASLTVLCVCQVAVMALWFSASAVIPSLAAEYGLSGFTQSLFTSSVQAGFVAGSLTSAVLGLADRLDPRRFFMAAALIAATANFGILLVEPTSAWVVLFRFITGVCMAGIYPVGMKHVSTWVEGDMGLMIGVLVGAITLGTAMPHLFNALGGIDWRFTLAASSASALVAAFAINLTGIGPNSPAPGRFRARDVLWAWRVESVRLANLGCLAGGLFADRLGRTTLTMLAMAVSGTCAATVGFLYGGPPWLLSLVCLLWGIAIVADSAQFSASVAELSRPGLVGTMLTLQTALGFTLTLITIHLMPLWVDWLGWKYAFMPLAVGPALGVWAMARLRAHPDSAKLAGGRR